MFLKVYALASIEPNLRDKLNHTIFYLTQTHLRYCLKHDIDDKVCIYVTVFL
jgi:hypothetical protein